VKGSGMKSDDDIRALLDRLGPKSIRMQARWLLDDIGDDWSIDILKMLLLKFYREYASRQRLQ
jgi:hypothetical protein